MRVIGRKYNGPRVAQWPIVFAENEPMTVYRRELDRRRTYWQAAVRGDWDHAKAIYPNADHDRNKADLDGYNLIPALKGEGAWPRHEFLYFTDDGNCAALRYDRWKISFLKQDAHGTDVWRIPFVELRSPMICDLLADPFERAERDGMGYNQWWIDHLFVFAPAGGYVAQWMQSFREFPPRQKPGSFNLDRVMEAVTTGARKNAN